MKILRWFTGLAAIAALSATAVRLPAQTTTGSIGGRITNGTGQGIGDVQVKVVNTETGISVGGNTRSDGSYLVPGLEVGDRYRVTIRRIGYAPQTNEPVRVSLGETTPLNFTIVEQATTLGPVTVTAAAAEAIIAPSQRGSQTTITDTLLRKLPTLNRNFTDFVALTPQVSTSGPGLSGGGVNNRYNNIQIDGATEKDLFGLGSTGQPGGQAGGKSISIESVKEYQVLLAPYDVRVGNFSGLSINAVTKSGTNDVNGSLYTYWRDRSMERDQPYLTAFNQTQSGLSVGGPIVKDKIFYFINPEWQTQARPASGIAIGDPNVRVTQALVDQFSSALTSRGLNGLGTADRVPVKNPLTNLFARFDFALPWNSSLVLRDNYAHATQDVFSRGSATSGTPVFPLTSWLYQFTSEKNAPVAQLRTNFLNGSYNEAFVAFTRIRDRRATPGTLQPAVAVFDNNVAEFEAGTENSSQANQLDQDITELTDNYTFPIGSSNRFTVGGQGQWYKVRNLFGQNSVGLWTFGTLDSLAAGTPRSYQIAKPVCPDGTIGGAGCDGAVRFRAGQFAGYLQDDWTATQNFNMSIGVRFDDPVFFTKPPTNPLVQQQFGINTAQIPSGNVQISPRVGFNWNVTGDDRNQLRGGVGMFQSAPAYVWMSNSFQNSGGVSGFANLNCNNAAAAPAFTSAAVATPPTACRTNITAAAGSEVDFANPNLKFPQVLRGNLAYDRDLGHGFVGTFEGLYTKAINSLFYYNLALVDTPVGTGLDGRTLYGLKPLTPSLKVSTRNTVYDVVNESKDHSYSLTGQLQKRFTRDLGGSIAYTYTQALSIQDLTSSTAGSQYRFGRTYSGGQLDVPLSHSEFETPNRIIGDLSYTLPTKTSLSVIYTGQSGIHFTYISSNDLNGDNQTLNDPVYVPTGPTDPKGPVFSAATIGGVAYTAAQEAAAFDNFISSTSCLNDQRGRIVTNNSCGTPWTNEFDISAEQALTTIRGQNVSLRLDIFNFGNLVNKNWGRQISTGNFTPVTLYSASGVVLPGGAAGAADLTTGVPKVTFDPKFNPFTYNNIFSNYSMQLSFRYSF
ncbi:MAG: carboxypeptidase regulatory-like domain-containing protein [Gemmatimonadales bacterium]